MRLVFAIGLILILSGCCTQGYQALRIDRPYILFAQKESSKSPSFKYKYLVHVYYKGENNKLFMDSRWLLSNSEFELKRYYLVPETALTYYEK